MSAHTPGMTSRLEAVKAIREKTGLGLKEAISIYEGGMTLDDALRDLRIRDAAPEIFSSLRELVDSPNAKENSMWNRARAAIEKAEGRRE